MALFSYYHLPVINDVKEESIADKNIAPNKMKPIILSFLSFNDNGSKAKDEKSRKFAYVLTYI